MSQIKKHVGKIKSTDRRCVIVYMQLPEAQDKALIIDVEALTPRFEQIIGEIVNSPNGQNAQNLAEYMSTRAIPETGRTVLTEFHLNGFLRTEPVANIIMMPTPSNPIPLTEVLKSMGTLPESVEKQQSHEAEKFNAVVNNLHAGKAEERLQMATNLLYEAELLEAEAAKKRESAYQYAPTLRPVVKTPDAVQETVEPTVVVATAEETAPKKSGRGGDRRSKAAKSESNAG